MDNKQQESKIANKVLTYTMKGYTGHALANECGLPHSELVHWLRNSPKVKFAYKRGTELYEKEAEAAARERAVELNRQYASYKREVADPARPPRTDMLEWCDPIGAVC